MVKDILAVQKLSLGAWATCRFPDSDEQSRRPSGAPVPSLHGDGGATGSSSTALVLLTSSHAIPGFPDHGIADARDPIGLLIGATV